MPITMEMTVTVTYHALPTSAAVHTPSMTVTATATVTVKRTYHALPTSEAVHTSGVRHTSLPGGIVSLSLISSRRRSGFICSTWLMVVRNLCRM